MIIVWTIAWWLNNFPPVHPWNTWFIFLIISLVLL